ncbi:hypothetical protein MJH12_18470, partial [bacterium]|nr:hypothetical protein [bacterium]
MKYFKILILFLAFNTVSSSFNILPKDYSESWFKHYLLLKEEKYVELEQDLKKLVSLVKQNPSKGYHLHRALYLYSIDRKDILKFLLKWKKSSNLNYYA